MRIECFRRIHSMYYVCAYIARSINGNDHYIIFNQALVSFGLLFIVWMNQKIMLVFITTLNVWTAIKYKWVFPIGGIPHKWIETKIAHTHNSHKQWKKKKKHEKHSRVSRKWSDYFVFIVSRRHRITLRF